MKLRLLMINRSYWPDTEATGQLLTELCEGLSEEFEVHVLAGQPNVALTAETWRDRQERNGVRIHRVQHAQFPKRSIFGRALNFLSFVRACHKHIGQLPQPDIVVFETDPFLLPFVADRYCRRTGAAMVGWLQDIYPDVAVALGKVRNSWAIRRLRKSLFAIYRRCQRIVVLSRDMRELMAEGSVSADRLTIIPNWADTERVQPVSGENRFRQAIQAGDRFVVMYSGNMGLTQRLEEFVEAASLLRDEAGILFVFVGDGARRRDLESLVAERGLTNAIFRDYQPLSELSHSLGAGDLHLIPLTAELSRCLMPSKLYGVLAAGRCFLTNAPAGSELHDIAVGGKLGFTVPPGRPDLIAAKIREIAADRETLNAMNSAARREAEQKYTRADSIRRFAACLRDVAAESKRT